MSKLKINKKQTFLCKLKRTYGPWWKDLPSNMKFSPTLKEPLFISQDFIGKLDNKNSYFV